MRFPRRAWLLALCVVLALGAGSAAAAQRGVLTRSEFQQLQHAKSRIKSLVSSEARSFSKANAVCTHMHQVSRLIVAVRNGCLDLIRLGGDDNKLNAQATKCGINPGSEAGLLTCLVPAVRGYYDDASAFYRAESHVNELAKARGFSKDCVAVIGDSPGNIAAEGRLAQDLRAAVSALQQGNPNALQTLPDQIHADIESIKPGPSSLALCPHQ
jgi:hypothetical protein